MPLNVSWYVDQEIILIEYHGTINQQDGLGMDSMLLEKLDSVDHPVALIFDTRDVEGVPMSWGSLVQQLRGLRHKNRGPVVVVEDSQKKFIKFVTDFFGRVLGITVNRAESVEDARHLLQDLKAYQG